MFCTECGLNAGDAKFCPRCGAVISAEDMPKTQPAAEAVEPADENSRPAQPQMDTLYEENAKAQQTIAPGFDTQAYMQSGIPERRGRKKWPKVLGIVAAAVLLIGLGIYFAFPYISEAISPKKQAVAALKNAGGSFEKMVSNVVSASPATTPVTKKQSKGAMKFENLNAGDWDFLSDLKVDTLNYDIQMDTASKEISGTFGLSSGNSAPVLTLKYYMDSTYMYFQIPELFQESFKISLNTYMGNDTAYYYSLIQAMASGIDTSGMEQYAGIVEAVVKDCVKGFNTMVDHCEYKKNGTQTLESDGISVKTVSFDVTVTAEALSKGFSAAVDAMYEDKALSAYMSMLAAFGGYSKDTLKSSLDMALAGMQDITFTMYVKDRKIAGLDLDVSQIDSTADGILSLWLLGESDAPYIRLEAVTEDVTVTMKYDGREDNKIFECYIAEDQSPYPNEFVDVYLDIQASGNDFKINEYSIQCNIDQVAVDIKLSSDGILSEFSKMSLTAGDFSNPLNLDYLTEEQEEKLNLEAANHQSVFKKIMSDDLYQQIFYGSILSSY